MKPIPLALSVPLGILIKDKYFYWSGHLLITVEKHCPVIFKKKKTTKNPQKIKCLKSFWKALLGKTGHSVRVENLLQHYLKVLHMVATGD